MQCKSERRLESTLNVLTVDGKVRDGKLEEKDTIMLNNKKSNGETINEEYIAALESELEVIIFYMYIVYGSN